MNLQDYIRNLHAFGLCEKSKNIRGGLEKRFSSPAKHNQSHIKKVNILNAGGGGAEKCTWKQLFSGPRENGQF